jgi:hypothetical protein
MINQSIQDHHLDTTILSTEPNGIMVWTHHHKKSARKDIHLPIVSENQNDPQHKNILQSKPNFVPENKNDLQHHTNLAKQTKFLFQRTKMIRNTHKSCKANQVFVPENKNDPQHTNFSCQL